MHRFDRDIWFELGGSTWKKNWRVYHDYVKYIRNDIVKPFRVVIIKYNELVRNMHNLAKYFPPPLMKYKRFESYNWAVRD